MPRSATPRCRKSYASMPHGIDPKAKGEDRLANVTTPQCREGNGRPVYYRARILPCTGVAPPRRRWWLDCSRRGSSILSSLRLPLAAS